ncbi:MAG: hypothetical protein JSV03_07330 [Planctomycetota bacterium]|nr:MAG: hypothetical protein JSV03_07330 [Planctomycetota bacterium]
MIYPIVDIATAGKPATLTIDHIAWLANTYERIPRPIWIHDLSAKCLYRNPPARSVSLSQAKVTRFEILDHDDRIIGHLTTIKN